MQITNLSSSFLLPFPPSKHFDEMVREESRIYRLLFPFFAFFFKKKSFGKEGKEIKPSIVEGMNREDGMLNFCLYNALFSPDKGIIW